MNNRSRRLGLVLGCLLVLALTAVVGAQPAVPGHRIHSYDPGEPLATFEQREGPSGEEVVDLNQKNKSGSLSPDDVHPQIFDLF